MSTFADHTFTAHLFYLALCHCIYVELIEQFYGFTCWVQPTCNEALLEMFRIDYLGTVPYVSCIPSLIHHRLSSSDRFLVLSSDGLYQYFSNEEVVAHVTWFMENVPEGDPAQYLIAELLFRAAKKNGQLIDVLVFFILLSLHVSFDRMILLRKIKRKIFSGMAVSRT